VILRLDKGSDPKNSEEDIPELYVAENVNPDELVIVKI